MSAVVTAWDGSAGPIAHFCAYAVQVMTKLRNSESIGGRRLLRFVPHIPRHNACGVTPLHAGATGVWFWKIGIFVRANITLPRSLGTLSLYAQPPSPPRHSTPTRPPESTSTAATSARHCCCRCHHCGRLSARRNSWCMTSSKWT